RHDRRERCFTLILLGYRAVVGLTSGRSTMQDWAITFEGAGKRFDDRWVVEDLDLSVPRAAIFGLIGPSGCGKTTTVRMANGVYRPDAGRVTLFGKAPTELSARQRAAIGYLPQQPA